MKPALAASPVGHSATLPMYDLDELRAPTDALWAFIATELRRAGINAPDALTRGGILDDLWTDPGLLLGQTCGYPLVTTLKGRVALLATPCYGAPGCDGPYYRSAIVIRAGNQANRLAHMRGSRCAINDLSSNSGMNVLRFAIAGLGLGDVPFFEDVVVTGGHVASVSAVADGRADIAAIDCVTWAHLQRWRPSETHQLRVLSWSEPSPSLPWITSLRADAATIKALRNALERVITSEALAPIRAALLLDNFATLPLIAYDAVMAMEQQARMAGYARLR